MRWIFLGVLLASHAGAGPEACVDYIVRSELPLGTSVRAVAVGNGTAYAVDTDRVLYSIDVTDPDEPLVLDFLIGIGVTEMAVAGEHLFLVHGAGFEIISVKNPGLMEIVAQYSAGSAIHAFTIDEGYAYLALGADGTEVVDVRDPTDPQFVSRIEASDVDGFPIFGAHVDVTVKNSIGYFANGQVGIDIYNFSEPFEPQLLNAYMPEGFFLDWTTVGIRGDILYATVYGASLDFPALLAIDVNDPLDPMITDGSSTLFHPEEFHFEAGFMHSMHFGRVYTTGIDGEGSMEGSGSSRVPFYGSDMAFDGSLAYIANGVDGLMVLDIDTECPPVCWADLNGDGVLNFFDIALWIPAYLDGERAADTNNDGLINFSDISALLEAFGAGCP